MKKSLGIVILCMVMLTGCSDVIENIDDTIAEEFYVVEKNITNYAGTIKPVSSKEFSLLDIYSLEVKMAQSVKKGDTLYKIEAFNSNGSKYIKNINAEYDGVVKIVDNFLILISDEKLIHSQFSEKIIDEVIKNEFYFNYNDKEYPTKYMYSFYNEFQSTGSQSMYDAVFSLDSQDKFRDGTNVSLVKEEETLKIPYDYVIEEDGKFYTFIDGTKVEIFGVQNNSIFEVSSGVSVGDEISLGDNDDQTK